MVEQVKVLKHHSDVFAHLVDIHLFCRKYRNRRRLWFRGRLLKTVETTQKGGFSRAEGPITTTTSPSYMSLEISPKHLDFSEGLFKMLHMNFYVIFIDGHGLASFREPLQSFERAVIMMRYIMPTISHVSKDLKVMATTFLALLTSSGKPITRKNGCILKSDDELIDDAWDHGSDGLRKDNLSHGLQYVRPRLLAAIWPLSTD